MKEGTRALGIPGRYQGVIDWSTLVVVLALIALQTYRGLTAGSLGDTPSMRNLGIALALLGGLGLYYTSAWRPELYIVGATFVGTLTVFWALARPVTVALEVGRVLLGGSLFLLCLYLFFRAQYQYEHEQDRTDSASSVTERRS